MSSNNTPMTEKNLMAGAEFSECGKYRYKLWRVWDKSLPLAMCIGLNPSTANASKNDNTINILIRVLGKLGYGGFYMMNLFAWISSKPEDLLTCDDPLNGNDWHLAETARKCKDVIFCWGAFKEAAERIRFVESVFTDAKCFGFNQNGTPWHPRALSYKGLLNSPQLLYYNQTADQL
jgi:hypothetical protein